MPASQMSSASQLNWHENASTFNRTLGYLKSVHVHRPLCQQHPAFKGHSCQAASQSLLGKVTSARRQQASSELQQLAASHGAGHDGGGPGGLGTRRIRTADGFDGAGSFTGRLSALQLILLALMPATIMQLLHAQPAHAASKAKVSSQHHDHFLSSWEIDAFVERMWELSGPILNNMGFSGLLGAAAAAALKMAGRMFAASLGLTLIVIQVLSYNNIITVNWSVVHEQARQVLDTTEDGRLDADEFKRALKKGLVILSEGVPSVSGFLIGFVIGLKLF